MFHTTQRHLIRMATASLALLLFSAAAQAGDRENSDVSKKLNAMSNVDTDWHPDLAGEFNGMRYYAHGKYSTAMEQFKQGAYYADKLSQLSIGLMYLNGEGVAKDPVTAYAWLSLAAERDYATFVVTRDRVKAGLTAEQLQRADRLHSELAVTYGDAVAKPRLANQLALGQMNLTGSRTGWNPGVLTLPADAFQTGGGTAGSVGKCAGLTIMVGYAEAPIAGCGGETRYARAFWEPNKYFAGRDAVWNANVTVGPLQSPGDKDASPVNKQPL
jgi:hypothetical protein